MIELQNAMTVDVEDYFQVSAFENYISRDSWDKLPHRVERNVERILALFAEHNISATFFVLGWIAERYPKIIHHIVDAGHELASHGYSHIRITQQEPEAFREDILKTKNLLEDISGVAVNGYRAASYSIDNNNHWAHHELELAGHKYSSSIYPIIHDLYGIPDSPRFHYKVDSGDLLEIPISTYQCFGYRIPCGGGGYFRLFPYFISQSMIRRVNKDEGKPCVFYFHPWELDFDQPRTENIDLKTRFRHYNGLKQMEQRLGKLLKAFNWGRMDKIFLP